MPVSHPHRVEAESTSVSSSHSKAAGSAWGERLALAAVAGIIAGTTGCSSTRQTPQSTLTIPAIDATRPASVASTSEPAIPRRAFAASKEDEPASPAQDCCKGLNDCKGKGNCKTAGNACKGQNACKGLGGCKPSHCEKNCCKGQNQCKGQGNCKTDLHACKGMNECKGTGGCRSSDCG